MIKKFIFYVILLAAFLFCNESIIGRVHSVIGDVNIYSSNYVNPHRKAIIGRTIYEGDQVVTGDNAICQILYDDNDIFVRISKNSKIKFSKAGFSDIIDLTSGQIYCQKAKNIDNLKIFTSIGQFNTTNGRFWVSTKLNKNDELLIHSGHVNLNNQYSLSDIKLFKSEAALSYTNGEVFVGSYKKINLIDLKDHAKIIDDFVQPYINNSNILDINSFDLIPQYKFKRSILENSIQSFKNYRYQFGNNINGNSYIQFISYYHKFDFKIGLAIPFFMNSDGFRKSDWDDFFDLIDRINYLEYQNFEKKYEIILGKIENKTWGAGGLLYKYRNTQNYPSTVRTGLDYTSIKGKKFLKFNFFISNFRDLNNSGGLTGFRYELFLTDKFPLTIGLGFIADFNNYAEINDQLSYKTRTVWGSELDLDYKLIPGVNNYVDIYFEYDRLYYNKSLTYHIYKGDIVAPGSENWIIGTEIKRGNLVSNIMLELSGHTMNSQFFNSLYDLERARYISIPKEEIDPSFAGDDESENRLATYQADNYLNYNIQDSTWNVLIPKEVYSIYADRLNHYRAPGLKFSLERSFGNKGHFKFGYGLKIEKLDQGYYNYIEQDNSSTIKTEYTPKVYHNLEIDAGIGDKVITGISEFNFFYLQYNAPTFFSYSDVYTSAEIGFNISIRPMQFMRLIIESKMIHYDYDYDGIIDKSNNLNIEIKFSI